MQPPGESEVQQRDAAQGIVLPYSFPLFTYLRGLPGPAAARAARNGCTRALVTDEEFVICRCAEWPGTQPGGVYEELGRIRKADLREVKVFAPSSPAFHTQVVAARVGIKILNKGFRKVAPGKLRFSFYTCLMVLRVARDGVLQDIWFGIPPVENPPPDDRWIKPDDLVGLLPPPLDKVAGGLKEARDLLKPLKTDEASFAKAQEVAYLLAELATAPR